MIKALYLFKFLLRNCLGAAPSPSPGRAYQSDKTYFGTLQESSDSIPFGSQVHLILR